jgi:hypothetical protein
VIWCGRVFQVLIERVVECGALVGRCSWFLFLFALFSQQVFTKHGRSRRPGKANIVLPV